MTQSENRLVGEALIIAALDPRGRVAQLAERQQFDQLETELYVQEYPSMTVSLGIYVEPN